MYVSCAQFQEEPSPIVIAALSFPLWFHFSPYCWVNWTTFSEPYWKYNFKYCAEIPVCGVWIGISVFCFGTVMHTQGYDYNLRRRLYCPKLFINDQTIYIPIFRLMQPAHTHTLPQQVSKNNSIDAYAFDGADDAANWMKKKQHGKRWARAQSWRKKTTKSTTP